MKPILCRSEKCKKEIVFLMNAETQHTVPVDYDSLTTDEIKGMNSGVNVFYNKMHHVSHYKTCADPNRFKKIGGRKKFGSSGNKI